MTGNVFCSMFSITYSQGTGSMGSTSRESVKRKVFPKGQIVIPVALRKKYHIDIGDHVDVIPKADGILLKPVPKKEETKSMTDCLFGIFRKYGKKGDVYDFTLFTFT